jgi:hypothetical protein
MDSFSKIAGYPSLVETASFTPMQVLHLCVYWHLTGQCKFKTTATGLEVHFASRSNGSYK